MQKMNVKISVAKNYQFMLSNKAALRPSFSACSSIFKVIILISPNQGNYFENATACRKRTLKTTVATQLNMIFFVEFDMSWIRRYSKMRLKPTLRMIPSFTWILEKNNEGLTWINYFSRMLLDVIISKRLPLYCLAVFVWFLCVRNDLFKN